MSLNTLEKGTLVFAVNQSLLTQIFYAILMAISLGGGVSSISRLSSRPWLDDGFCYSYEAVIAPGESRSN